MSGLLRFVVAFGLAAMTMAQIVPNTSVAAMLGMIPKCSTPCVFDHVFQQGGCPFSDATELSPCACTNMTLQSHLSACVQKSCGFRDQVDITSFSAQLCEAYPKESRVIELKTVSVVTIVLSSTFLILRLYSRWLNTRKWYADDAYAIIAAVLLITVSVIILRMSIMGFGLHYWHVPTGNGVELLRYFYVCQMLYILVQIFSKVAILALYIRVFPGSIRWFHRSVRFMIAFMFLHGLVFLLLVVFQCLPIRSIWDKTIDGKCLPIAAAIGFTGAGLSIAEDFIILLLPMNQLWKLQMSDRKKIGLIFLLSIGSFASITSIIRLKFVLKYANTYDSTWDNVDVLKWSLIEILLACICGNLLSLRPLFQGMMPSVRSAFGWYSDWSHKSSDMTSSNWRVRTNKNKEKRKVTSTLRSTRMSRSPGWDWQKPNTNEMVLPTTPFRAYVEKSDGTADYCMSDMEAPSIPQVITKQGSSSVLNSIQTSTVESNDGTSRFEDERNLIVPRGHDERRISGPWSYALSVFDRR